MVATSSGCTILSGIQMALSRHESCDEFMVGYRNRALAEKAWHREKRQFARHQYIRDLKAGFIDGYLDVAGGGRGCVPAVCPPKYWGWQYQSPDGQAACNAWFEGFPLGAKAAEEDGVGYWSHIRLRGSIERPPYQPGEHPTMIVPGDGEQIVPGSVIEIETPEGEPRPAEEAEGLDPGDRGIGSGVEKVPPALPEPTGDLGGLVPPRPTGSLGPGVDQPENTVALASRSGFPAPQQSDIDAVIGDLTRPGSPPMEMSEAPNEGEIRFRFE